MSMTGSLFLLIIHHEVPCFISSRRLFLQTAEHV